MFDCKNSYIARSGLFQISPPRAANMLLIVLLYWLCCHIALLIILLVNHGSISCSILLIHEITSSPALKNMVNICFMDSLSRLVISLGLIVMIAGTDDDLPPTHQNRIPRGGGGGRLAANGRSAVGSIPYPRVYGEIDMEAQIHQLEQEAYSSVLRAFKAQADAITWVYFII